ncbi:hypothetical protein KKI23_03620 [Patescibacteria group bacterium]|nr:hypothetical protein [Patescibacteria group bacterium]
MNYEGKIWRILTNIWTLVAIVIFVFDFVSNNRYDASAGAVSAVYIAVLSIYVGTKEFERWQANYARNYYGEMYIIIWTIFVIIVCAIAPFSGGHFRIPPGLVVVYTVILSIFAISRRSKTLYFRRQAKTKTPLAKFKRYVKVNKRKKR